MHLQEQMHQPRCSQQRKIELMARAKIFIDGEAGTTGLQIRARLTHRSDIELISITHDKRKDDDERQRLLNSVDVAVLCLPDDAARAAVAMISNPNVRVLDASTAHRTQPDWVYGIPELAPHQADKIRTAHRVANPGCYSSGMVLLVRPLVDAGLLPPEVPLTVQGISGYSGGGRQMIDSFEGRGANVINDPIRLYALELNHKHVEEMRLHSGLVHRPLFVPAVGKFAQGMLVEIPLQLWALPKPVSGLEIHQALAHRYANQRFIKVMPLDPRPAVHLAPDALNGSNRMEIFVFENRAEQQALLVARLDNLGKGASGAAVQNLDLMLGLGGSSLYELPAD